MPASKVSYSLFSYLSLNDELMMLRVHYCATLCRLEWLDVARSCAFAHLVPYSFPSWVLIVVNVGYCCCCGLQLLSALLGYACAVVQIWVYFWLSRASCRWIILYLLFPLSHLSHYSVCLLPGRCFFLSAHLHAFIQLVFFLLRFFTFV